MTYGTWKKFWLSRVKPKMPWNKGDKPEPSLPLGLSPDQLSQIQALTEMTPYKHYLVAVERLYENNLSALLRALPHDAYLFQCGVCFALEQIAKLPADLIAKGKELDARHTHDTSDTPVPDAASVFVNTPFWDAYQRLGKRAHQYGGPRIQVPGQRDGASVSPGENGG